MTFCTESFFTKVDSRKQKLESKFPGPCATIFRAVALEWLPWT
jgi:hypothetical protein